jgi:iron only hydrogenase large subunit-like protein
LKEVTLYDPETVNSENPKVLLKFAQAYGFRNIQNIIRKIKQGKCEYDYVELMACPSGCVNGGGQIKL